MFLRMLVALFLPVAAWAGGSFSGGEDGVVCFPDAPTAEAAVENGVLKSEYKSKVSKVYAAEYWEGAAAENPCNARIRFKSYRTSAGNLRARDMISFAMLHLGIYRPNLVKRLDEIETLIGFDRWDAVTAVEPVDDSEISESPGGGYCRMSQVPKSSNCRVVQLARRDQIGPKKYRITFDAELYRKLDPLNQAMVQLHERVYLLGSLLGHKRSENTRFLVMTLFEDRAAGEARAFGAALLAGDFSLYSELIDLEPHRPQPSSEDGRIRSYERLYDLVNEWADRHRMTVFKALTSYYPQFIQDMIRDGHLTGEMALMLYASMSSAKFDDLIDRRPDREHLWAEYGRKMTALEKACMQTQMDYRIAFDVLRATVRMGQGARWGIPRWSELSAKIEKISKARGNIATNDGACELAAEGAGPDALYFGQQCFVRRGAMEYCQSIGVDSRSDLEKTEGNPPPFPGVTTIRGDVWKKKEAADLFNLQRRVPEGERDAYVGCHRHITEVKMKSFSYSYWCQREASEKAWVLYANHPLERQLYYKIKSWPFR